MYCVYGNSGRCIHGGPLFGGGPLLGGSVIGGSTVLLLLSIPIVVYVCLLSVRIVACVCDYYRCLNVV